MFFNTKLAVFLSLAALSIASPVKLHRREFADVQEGLARISISLETLHTSITDYPTEGASAVHAMDVSNGISALITEFTDAVTFLDATEPLDSAQSDEVLASVQAIVPMVNDNLSGLAQLKPALDANPIEDVTGVTQVNLVEIKDSAVQFVDGLNTTTSIPESTLESIKQQIFASFDSAIATFST